MKKDFILLNGETFEVLNNCKSGKYMLENIESPCQGYLTIWNAYKQPSTRKQGIWKEWVEWFNDSFISGEIVVSSRNCNFFSISFRGYTEKRLYKGHITYSRNEVVYCER